MTVIDLLANGASTARRVLAEHPPAMTRAAYLALLRSLESERTYQES